MKALDLLIGEKQFEQIKGVASLDENQAFDEVTRLSRSVVTRWLVDI